MKNRSWLIFVLVSLFFLVSCGGDENGSAQEDSGDADGENASVSIRAVKDAGCTGMQIDCLSQQLAAISFQIRNGQGETIFQKSVERKDLGSKHLEFKGIKNAENATLVVAAFGVGNDGLPDLNTPKWEGRASGLRFEKGKKTSVIILLYPRDAQAKEISMPEELITARFGHTSTVLADGRVLVAGGFTICSSLGKCPASKKVEVIDLESGRIEELTDMAEERAMHTAIALNDGSVLFIGGVHTLDTNWQETAFGSFPLMRYVFSTPSVKIEKYMPSYPKYNMKANGFGSPVSNISEPLSTADIPFSAFQSVLAERISDTSIDVFLVGGLDENGEPSKRSYKFTVTETEEGTVSVGEVEELAESSEPMLLPALAYAGGSLIAAGGRPAASEHAASVISESGSEDIGSASDNIFFAKGLSANGSFYTFGGYGLDAGALAESNVNKMRKWNIQGRSVESSNDLLLTRGNNIVFPETAYDSKNGRLFVIGGTNAADLFQVINEGSFELYSKAPTHTMTDKRIMSSAAVVPAGVIGDNPLIIISGGITSLDSAGSTVKSIKINNL
jgi:hypothetical protein